MDPQIRPFLPLFTQYIPTWLTFRSTFTLYNSSAQVTETHHYGVIHLPSFLNMLQMFCSIHFRSYTFLPVVLFQASSGKTSSIAFLRL